MLVTDAGMPMASTPRTLSAGIRARRKSYEQNIPAVFDILRRGSEMAREVASRTLFEMKEAMGINYFNGDRFVTEQTRRFQEAARLDA